MTAATTLLLVAALGVSLSAAPTLAGASAPPPGGSLRAIEPMKSGVSSLRKGPDGKGLKAAPETAAAASSSLGSSQQMGAPADKTIARVDDQIQVQSNTGTGTGNTSVAGTIGLNEDMTAIQGTPSYVPYASRSVLDHQYPSVSGRFLDATRESVLELKLGQAGSDAIYSLATTDAAAQAYPPSPPLGDIDLGRGGTYIINNGVGDAVTNVSAEQSSSIGSPARSAPFRRPSTATTAYSQQWAVVPVNNLHQLISRADGLCLAHTTDDASAEVVTQACSTDSSNLWGVSDGGNDNLWGFQVNSGVNDPGLYENENGTLAIGATQAWEAHVVTEPGGSVPTWSTVRTGGNTPSGLPAPYALAVGDLDGVTSTDDVTSSLAYHDEAVMAYTDNNDNWAVRVVDYNADPHRLLVTEPEGVTTGQTGKVVNGVRYPGDLLVNVGDFNGDGRNEIALAFQIATGEMEWSFFRYDATAGGGRELTLLDQCPGCGGGPFQSVDDVTLQQGYASSAVGDFDGDGRDDIAVAFAETASPSSNSPASHEATVNLGIWTLNPDLTTRSVDIISPPMDHGQLLPAATTNDAVALSGIRLVAGNFKSDPGNGFGPQRSELAMAWEEMSYARVSDPISGDDYRGYYLTPKFNIYEVDTDDCNSSGTTCTSATTPTNDNATPQFLFPSNHTLIAYRDFGQVFDIPGLSLASGAFGGTGADDPPVDGLIANAWIEEDSSNSSSRSYDNLQSIVVPWVDQDDTFTKWTVTDTSQGATSQWTVIRYTTYDALGKAVVLGAPQIVQLEQNLKENIVAAEPPTHVDWLDGGWQNVSATSAFYLQTKTANTQAFSSTTSNENSWNNAMHEGLDINATYSEDLFPAVNVKGALDVNQKFSKAWSGLSQSSTNTSNSWSTTASASTNQDDAFSYSADNTTLYRYPVIGTPGVVDDPDSCPSGCRTYYDVYMPQSSVQFDNVPGKSTSLFQPEWENMNALSYPAVSASNSPVPTPGLGSYSYVDSNGATQSVNKALYNQVNAVGANAGTIDLDFSSAEGSGNTQTHARTWTSGLDVSISGKVTVGDPEEGEGASVKTTASMGFDITKGTSGTTTGSSQTSSSQSFTLNVPQGISPGRGYNLGTAYYYGQDGSARVVHGVDLATNVQGKTWWLQNYGQTPDPALNLPGRIGLFYDTQNYNYDVPLWLTAPQRQLVRGFEALQASDDNSGLPTAGDPYTVNPTVGQGVTFSAPISNYSLAAMTQPTTVSWYAAPVDANDIALTSQATLIGTSVVPAMASQGSETVKSPTWTAPPNNSNSMQQYRIFMKIDPTGADRAQDLHPLAGDPCPVAFLEPTGTSTPPALYDTMNPSQSAPDPTGCGSNNMGYGLVTVSPPEVSTTGVVGLHATDGNPARAKLAGAGLVDDDPDHLNLTEDDDVPTIPVDQPITMLVHASAALQADDHPIIAVYDGPPSEGNIVAVTRMNGIDDQTGGHVSFSWTPTTPGLHKLHQVLLSTSATGEDDEQIMNVDVAAPLTQYAVQASATPSTVKPGAAVTINGSATPVPAEAWQRKVELQRKVAATASSDARWETVDDLETNSRGAFDFALTAPDQLGSYQYRVWKTQTAGRPGAASGVLTIQVQNTTNPPPPPPPVPAFTVTLKADKNHVVAGRKVTFRGQALPWPPPTGSPNLVLQVRTGKAWKDVKELQVNNQGRFVVKVKASNRGTFRFRVAQTGSGTLSPTVKVVVKKKRR